MKRNLTVSRDRPMQNKRVAVILFTIIAWTTIVFVLYGGILHSGFRYDDYFGILENGTIRDVWNAVLHERLFRRITYITFALNYAWGGLDSFGYHLVNVLIHLCNAFGVAFLWYFLLKANSKSSSPNAFSPVVFAWLAGLLFLIHPSHVESVTYIYQRSTSLVAFFYVFTLVFYIYGRMKCRYTPLIISGIFMLACFFSKRISVSLPLVVGILELMWLRKNYPNKTKHFIAMVALLAFVIPALTLWTHGWVLKWENLYPIPEGLTLSFKEYFLTQFRVLVSYLRIWFWPLNLNLDYDYPVTTGVGQAAFLLPVVFHVLVLTAALMWRKTQLAMTLGVISYYLILAPELLVMRDLIFDHRLYLPSIFLSGMTVYCLAQIMFSRALKLVIVAAIVLFWSRETYQYNKVWSDRISLWEYVVEKSPNKARPHMYLGLAHASQGHYAKATEALLAAYHKSPHSLPTVANLGFVYREQGQDDKALPFLLKAIEINPRRHEPHHNLANIYAARGQNDLAEKHFQIAIDLRGDLATSINGLANLYKNTQRESQAMTLYQRAIHLDPLFLSPYTNLANLLTTQGHHKEAEQNYLKALKLDPNHFETNFNLALLNHKQNNLPAARHYYTTALNTKPNHTPTQKALQQIS